MVIKIEMNQADLEAVILQHVYKMMRDEVGVSEKDLGKMQMNVAFNIWQNHDEAGFDGVSVTIKK